jgi:hypothetical protein
MERKNEIGSVALDKLPDITVWVAGGMFSASALVVYGAMSAVVLVILAVTLYLLYHRFVIKDFEFFGPDKGFQTEKVVWKVRKRRRRRA